MHSWLRNFGCQVFQHAAGLFRGAFAREQVGEEEDFQHGEQDEEFDEDDGPQGASHGHFAESLDVKPDHFAECLHFVACWMFYQS